MPLGVPIEQITEAVLRELIANQVSEAKTIEYKQSLPGTSDGDRKEFLADVSSFANASGGHLVYGMKEDGGLPVELCGLDEGDPDAVVSTIDSRIRDGIKPRIPGVVVWWVPLDGGRGAAVVRVPKSFASPHMVTYKGTSRFFSRHSNGKYQLDVEEIRASFLLSDSIAERIREFRLDRIARIRGNDTPVPLPKGAKVALHVVPLAAFSGPTLINLHQVAKPSPEILLTPLAHEHSGWNGRFNIDGYVRYALLRDEQLAKAYIQVYRNGVVETVDASLLDPYQGQLFVPSVAFEEEIIKAIRNYTAALQRLDVNFPLVIMLTLLGVSGYRVGYDTRFMAFNNGTFDRDTLLIPELIIETFKIDVGSVMKQSFDMVWNAAGWERSLCYDENGVRKKSP